MPLTPGDLDDGFVPVEEVTLPSELGKREEATSADSEPTPSPTSTLPTEFDPRHREDFKGLLYLGALSHEFVQFGHRFKVRTLTVGEYMEVGLAQKLYRDTIGFEKAYITGLVAACLVSVDGKPLPMPLSTSPTDTEFANKFAYVRDSWFPWVVDAVYEQFIELDQRAAEVLDSMGKALPLTAPSIPG